MIFEEFGFQSYVSRPAPFFSIRRHAQQHPEVPAARAFTGVVLDSGFSFSHAVPIFNGQVMLEGVRRLNLGGKALTNYFKEQVSYRWAPHLLRCEPFAPIMWSQYSTAAACTDGT